ncbi:MAG: sulfate permease [Anaerolineae bacterium]
MTSAAHTPPRKSTWMGYVPILSWLPHYDRSWLRLDVLAGLTLWGLVVPEAMAYAGIAGLPPQAGLYTLLASLLIYALLGTSRHLVVQATSATAALLATSVTTALIASAALAEPGTESYQAYASAFVLVVGLVFLAAGIARIGFVTQFLSKPVMDGFVMGLAIFVTVGQLNKLFGVEKPEGNTVQKLLGIIQQLPEANWAAFAVGALALAVLFLLPVLSKKIPAGLIVLFGAIALSTALGLNANYGVEIVGTLPQGLPSLTFPQIPIEAYLGMVLPAIGVLLVAFSEGLGVAHEFAEKHHYEVNADQELNATGVVNIVSAFFGGMLAGGSMSASAVKEGAGAHSQVANLVTWVATIITLLFLTPLFTSLPEAVLAALIIHALWHIIASRKMYRIWRESRVEFWFALLALAGVLLVDVLQGMLIGVVASLVFVIYKSSRPHLASLGRVPHVAGAYSDIARHPDSEPVPGILIVRIDTPLYYANALSARDRLKAMIDERDTPLRAIILDLAAQDEIDLTTSSVFVGFLKDIQKRGITLCFAEVHTPVLENARKSGLAQSIGEDHIFPTVDAAVRDLMGKANPTDA